MAISPIQTEFRNSIVTQSSLHTSDKKKKPLSILIPNPNTICGKEISKHPILDVSNIIKLALVFFSGTILCTFFLDRAFSEKEMIVESIKKSLKRTIENKSWPNLEKTEAEKNMIVFLFFWSIFTSLTLANKGSIK